MFGGFVVVRCLLSNLKKQPFKAVRLNESNVMALLKFDRINT